MPTATGRPAGPEALETALRTALHHHETGQLATAQRWYREALDLAPSDPDALHLAAVLAHQSGGQIEALELVDQALSRLPGFGEAHNTRGNVLRALGRPDDALGALRQAIVLLPGSPLPWSNLGNALRELGRPEEAVRAYQEALQRDPMLAELYFNLGVVQAELGRPAEALGALERTVLLRPGFAAAQARLGQALGAAARDEEAVDCLRRAVSLDPGLTEAFCELGAALFRLGRYQEATDAVQAALALDPESPDAHNCLGNVCRALGYPDQALSAYRQALAASPDHAEVHFNLGLLLEELRRPVEAVASYRAALTFRADFAEAHAALGSALLRQGRSSEAVTALRRALEHRPGLAIVWHELGRALSMELRPREAVAALERATLIEPGNAVAHADRAQELLALGDYATGLDEYEWRFRLPLPERRPLNSTLPRWDGGPLDGRTIFVTEEAGLSSTLQFARFLPLLEQQGGRVLLECGPDLSRLLEAMPAIHQVVPRGDVPEADCAIPIESLPLCFGTRLPTVPDQVPYLPVQLWSGRIPPLPAGSGLRVGLVWQAPVGSAMERSIPLSRLAPLLALPGITWYSLQVGEGAEQLPGTRIIDLRSQLRDFADTAALVGQLDLVVTVDGPVAHLAGGLGRPVWVLLDSAPAWVWGREGTETPWYPTARLFRQVRPHDLAGVIELVREALEQQVSAEAVRQ